MTEEKNKNPFAGPDGGYLEGKEVEFFQWEIDHAEEELKKLPPEEREKKIAAQKALNDRMNS